MYQKVFKPGKYGDFEVTPDMVQELADNYDPTYKKSPINIDHWGGESYGWIESVQFTGGFLEADITFTDEGKSLLATGKYKYPSIEVVDYDGKPYLRAIALTNYNRVKSLPELKYSENEEGENIRRFADPTCGLTFGKTDIEKPKSNIKMKTLIKQLAGLFSVNYSENSSDESVLESVIASAGDTLSKVKAFSDAEVTVEKFNEMKTKIESFSDQRAEDLVSSAVASNKIVAAQKEKYLKLAKADYDSVSEIFSEIKPGTAFVKNFIKDKSATGEDGADDNAKEFAEVKYEDVLRNPEKFVGKLSEEQFEGIKARAGK
jgi:hypothetical protein